jgi:hypothetical protein
MNELRCTPICAATTGSCVVPCQPPVNQRVAGTSRHREALNDENPSRKRGILFSTPTSGFRAARWRAKVPSSTAQPQIGSKCRPRLLKCLRTVCVHPLLSAYDKTEKSAKATDFGYRLHRSASSAVRFPLALPRTPSFTCYHDGVKCNCPLGKSISTRYSLKKL